jgi:hypothetical protein
MGHRPNEIIFISFFTPDYEKYATRLRQSLDRLELDHDIQPFPDKVSFTAIVKEKPAFILSMLKKHREKYDAVVWVDADAVVHHPPRLLYGITNDLAVHYRDGLELMSGTMFWRTSVCAERALNQWVKALASPGAGAPKVCNLDCPEQQMLQHMMPHLGISTYYLPSEYCKIFDLVEANDRARKVIPIIEHFQASRKTRVYK